jgi:UPF0716 protein FxsA
MPIMIGLLLLPLIEIAGFVWIGPYLGVAPTIAFVVLSALLGMSLLRTQGVATLMRLRASLAAGETPVPTAIDGACRIAAGILLIVPGFFSDALALLLLLPPVRGVVVRAVMKHVRPVSGGLWTARFGGERPPPSGTIEGEFHEVAPRPSNLPPSKT